MKKLFKILAYIALWVLVISVIAVCIYERHDRTARDANISAYTHVADNFYVDSNCNDEAVSVMNEFVDILPTVFVEEFRDDWVVIIEDKIEPPASWPSNVVIDAYTHWQSRVIILRNQTDSNKMLNTFVHEIGHCFDFEYGSVSYSDVFHEIYSLYQLNFLEQDPYAAPGYATSSPVEFFATCFKEYLLYPEHLKTAAPKAYTFIDLFYNNVLELKRGYYYNFDAVVNTLRRITEG